MSLLINPITISIAGRIASRVVDRLLAAPDIPVTPGQKEAVKAEVIEAAIPIVENMTNNEPWYRSNVTLGGIAAILGGIAGLITAYASGSPLEVYLTSLGSIWGGVQTIYGRWFATGPIGL